MIKMRIMVYIVLRPRTAPDGLHPHISSKPWQNVARVRRIWTRSRTWRKLNLASQRQTPSESQPLAVDASRAPSPQVDHRRDWPEVSCGLSVDDDQTLSTIVIALRKLDRPRTTPSVSHQLVERHGQMSYTGASMKGTVDTSCC